MSATQRQHERFRALMGDFSNNEPGFVIVRTAYDPDPATDASRWSAALSTLRAHIEPADPLEHYPGLVTVVMEDRDSLDGMNYDTARAAFQSWIAEYCRRDRNENGNGWESDIRRDCFLVVDDSVLASLLTAPPEPPAISDYGHRRLVADGGDPWIVAVDAHEPADVPYNGGAPYLGWTRSYVWALNRLNSDLNVTSLSGSLYPRREYDGQIPLYNGGRGELVDPAGGIEGRYKFPRGTPRGLEGARAMIDEIRAALGDLAVATCSVNYKQHRRRDSGAVKKGGDA
ncbi:hypothetical protein ColTof4_08705 [Colletotrichum tofieldiae]|nr:hypothetical protein ColTof3_04094 [Colletotrichum tofieldiae]GKT76282.1 hypothetical protein ColTof4_08705 [Colletotrichum tofieldiae]